MRAVDAALQAEALGLEGQGLDVARERVVAFIAVHVHRQAELGGQLTQQLHAGGAFALRALEVGNAADHVHAHVQRTDQVVQPAG
ncbi:hypothetical protein D9M68_853650 [compost metagenome]